MTATATIPESALELADLEARLIAMRATAGALASSVVGEPDCQRYLGQLEALAEVMHIVQERKAALTVGGGR
mgnify:CR=1 FL=1